MGATAAIAHGSETRVSALATLLTTAQRRSYEILAFTLPFVIFVLSCNHDVASWDTAEMQGVPYILGITHPTGFPLYILVGFAFSHLVAIGTIAFRLNLLSAICVAGACVAQYVTARDLGIPKMCALVAAWWFAVGAIVWNHAIRAEVHDMTLLLCAVTVPYVARWARAGDGNALVIGIACFGLALAAHPMAIWLTPGIVLACIMRAPPKPLYVRCSVLVVAALSLYAYLPIRSLIIVHAHLDPTLGLAGQDGALFWNLNDPSTLSGFLKEVSGSQFGAGHTFLSAINVGAMQTYLWNWMAVLNSTYGAFGLVLAFVGLARFWSRDWKSTLLLLVLCFAIVPFSYAYASVEGDSDRYRMIALWLVPLLMAGAATSTKAAPCLRDIVRVCFVFALMFLWGTETFANNRELFSNAAGPGNRAIITEAAARIPRGALIVTPWIDATTLAYGAYVDRSLDGRVVIAGWPNEEEQHFAAWLKRYPIYVIGNAQPNRYPGIEFSPQQPLDANHRVWRVERDHVLREIRKVSRRVAQRVRSTFHVELKLVLVNSFKAEPLVQPTRGIDLRRAVVTGFRSASASAIIRSSKNVPRPARCLAGTMYMESTSIRLGSRRTVSQPTSSLWICRVKLPAMPSTP